MANGPWPVAANILLSHTHWDHIQGFPFFAPAFVPGSRITICGPHGAHNSLPEVLAGQMEYTYFPVELAQLGAEIKYNAIGEGSHTIDGARVTAQFLNHPAVTLGYRLEADGVVLAYLCDHEPYWESIWCSDSEPGKLDSILHKGDRRHADFMENADVVIHDCQYTPEEYAAKKNWGHSTYSYVIQMAAAAGVKQLFLTHHDPTHNDEFVDGIEQKARQLAVSVGSTMQVSCAYEGYEEFFEGRSSEHAALSDVPESTIRGNGLRILIIDDDEDLRLLVARTLTRSGHQVLEAEGGREGLEMIDRERPDLILLDLLMPAPDGFEVLRELRSGEKNRLLPVIVFTAQGDEESARTSFGLGATDFLSKPFTPPQLDARVRSCFSYAPRQ